MLAFEGARWMIEVGGGGGGGQGHRQCNYPWAIGFVLVEGRSQEDGETGLESLE